MLPDNLDNRTLAAMWRSYAEGDVEAALACAARDAAHGWTIAFHCQQAVEKAYKGALVLRGGDIPRTHSLVLLHTLLADQCLEGPVGVSQLGLLTPFAIDDKYPSLRITPIPREDACLFIPVARLAVDWLGALLATSL